MKCLRLGVCMSFALTSLVAFVGCPAAGHKDGPSPGETRVFDGIKFVWVPCGTFTMGSPTDEVGHSSDETQHEVTISRGFWLGQYKVTQAQWEAVMGSNPSNFSGSTNPVEEVSWDDAQNFIAALNTGKSATGGPYRLPTESEWELAYRAGTTTRFYWGDDPSETIIDDYCWYSVNSAATTHPEGEKLPNAWGLYDMAGNVSDWVQDWSDENYPAGPVTDPQGPTSGTERVIRGGSWKQSAPICRAAKRGHVAQDGTLDEVGFRLVRTADEHDH